jgi:hypothetical protein
MKEHTFWWTQHIPFLGIQISVPHTQLSPAGKVIIFRLEVNHISNPKTGKVPLPEVQRFDF